MTVRQPRYSKEEFARRGNKIYETQVRSLLEAGIAGYCAGSGFSYICDRGLRPFYPGPTPGSKLSMTPNRD